MSNPSNYPWPHRRIGQEKTPSRKLQELQTSIGVKPPDSMDEVRARLPSLLLVGNYISPGVWEATLPADLASSDEVWVSVCTHTRLNDHGDACLDCGGVYMNGSWQ